MRIIHPVCLTGLLVIVMGQAPVQANVIYYSDSSVFSAAAPVSATETFESANVGTNSFAFIPGPLNSSINNLIFQPGSIVSGFSLASVGPYNPAFVVTGTGTIPGGTKEVGLFSPNTLELTFSGAPVAVGFNVFASSGPGNVVSTFFNVAIYGQNGSIGSQSINVQNVNSFFGAISDSDPISKIDIATPFPNIFVDNLTFSVPEPSSALLLSFGTLLFSQSRKIAGGRLLCLVVYRSRIDGLADTF